MPWRMSWRAEMQMADGDSGDRIIGGFDDGLAVFVGEFGFVANAGGVAAVLPTGSGIDSAALLQQPYVCYQRPSTTTAIKFGL